MTTSREAAEAEFADLEFQEANDNEITRQTANNLPLFLPWKRQYVRIGTCFQSRRQRTEDPWLEDSPFMLSDLYMIPKMLRREDGAQATYKSIVTAKQTETGDHLSLGFGAGVGLPFLASVSVKGTYDKHVQENKDDDKSSIRASLRAGSVELERQPRLSTEAMVMLKYGGGYSALCERYGDYYVAGYRLGGETGLLLSTSKFSKDKVEKIGVKVTVEVLFVSASKSWQKDFRAFSSGKRLTLLGYDTLDHANWSTTTEGGDFLAFQTQKETILSRSQNMLERVQAILDEQKMHEGDYMTPEQCQKLHECGLVVELMLLPISSLRDVSRWRTEHNII